MRAKLLAGATALVALAATAASAQSLYEPLTWFTGGGFYVGADGGYHFPETFKGSGTRLDSSGARPTWDFGTKSEQNWAGFAKLGYKSASGLRLELEYGYRHGDLDSIHGQASSPVPNALCAPGVNLSGGVCGKVKGNLNVSSAMINVIYDFQNYTLPGRFPIRPFIGGGVGGAFVQTKAYGELSGVPAGYSSIENTSFDDDKPAFAYQGIAGLTWDVAPHIAIDLTGRYFEADRVRAPSTTQYAGAGGSDAYLPVYDIGTFKGDYKDASVTIGLRYTFGGDKVAPPPPPAPLPAPEPAPAPAPPPVTPAPAPPATPDARQFVVYFPFDQSVLTTDAQSVVQAAATYAMQGQPTRIVVVGHTDTSGSFKYNLRLSERRAKTVADALVGLGVNQGVLAVDWKGKTDLAVATPDGTKEPLNRRSTIDINFQ